MTLTVTAGDASADSYLNAAGAKSYWDGIGFDYSGYSDTEIEQALRRATRWLDGRYRRMFPGERTNGRSQALEWPRSSVTDADGNDVASDEIPVEIENATAEAAKREVAGTTLSPDVTLADTVKSERVGPISTEYAAIPSTAAQRPTVLAVEEALGSLFPVGGATKFVSRA